MVHGGYVYTDAYGNTKQKVTNDYIGEYVTFNSNNLVMNKNFFCIQRGKTLKGNVKGKVSVYKVYENSQINIREGIKGKDEVTTSLNYKDADAEDEALIKTNKIPDKIGRLTYYYAMGYLFADIEKNCSYSSSDKNAHKVGEWNSINDPNEYNCYHQLAIWKLTYLYDPNSTWESYSKSGLKDDEADKLLNNALCFAKYMISAGKQLQNNDDAEYYAEENNTTVKSITNYDIKGPYKIYYPNAKINSVSLGNVDNVKIDKEVVYLCDKDGKEIDGKSIESGAEFYIAIKQNDNQERKITFEFNEEPRLNARWFKFETGYLDQNCVLGSGEIRSVNKKIEIQVKGNKITNGVFSLNLKKIDAITENELDGATFELYEVEKVGVSEENAELLQVITSTTKDYNIYITKDTYDKAQNNGGYITYKIKEIISPTGHKLINGEIYVKVKIYIDEQNNKYKVSKDDLQVICTDKSIGTIGVKTETYQGYELKITLSIPNIAYPQYEVNLNKKYKDENGSEIVATPECLKDTQFKVTAYGKEDAEDIIGTFTLGMNGLTEKKDLIVGDASIAIENEKLNIKLTVEQTEDFCLKISEVKSPTGYTILPNPIILTFDMEKDENGKCYIKEVKSNKEETGDKVEYATEVSTTKAELVVNNEKVVEEGETALQIIKYSSETDDNGNKIPLAGVKFGIYNSNNELMNTITTNKDGQATYNFEYKISSNQYETYKNNYKIGKNIGNSNIIIKEIEGLDGYQTLGNEETINVEAKYGLGKKGIMTNEIVVTNNTNQTVDIAMNNSNGLNNGFISAKQTVQYVNEELKDIEDADWHSVKQNHFFINEMLLKFGIENQKIERGKYPIKLKKVDATDANITLQGVQFKLYEWLNADNSTVGVNSITSNQTDGNGECILTIPLTKEGEQTFFIKELLTKNSYQLFDEYEYIELTVTVKSKPIDDGKFQYYATKVKIKNYLNEDKAIIVNPDNNFEVNNPETNEYSASTQKVLDSIYKISKCNPTNATFCEEDGNLENICIQVPNYKNYEELNPGEYQLAILKTSSTSDNKRLQGAKFELFDELNQSQGIYTTDKDGKLTIKKSITKEDYNKQSIVYYLKEIEAPSGYEKIEGKIKIILNISKNVSNYYVESAEILNQTDINLKLGDKEILVGESQTIESGIDVVNEAKELVALTGVNGLESTKYGTQRTSSSGFKTDAFVCASFVGEVIYNATNGEVNASNKNFVNNVAQYFIDSGKFDLVYYHPIIKSVPDISNAVNDDKNPADLLQPGDIVGTFSNKYTFQHVYIYLGDGKIADQGGVGGSYPGIGTKTDFSNTKYILRLKGETGTTGSTTVKDNKVELVIRNKAKIDLALKKFITGVTDNQGNYTATTGREPTYNTESLKTTTEATYTFDKSSPVEVEQGNIVRYKIRIYNEGSSDGYASVIKDHLPNGVKLAENSEINKQYGWTTVDDGKYISTTYLQDQKIGKYEGGITLNYKDVEVELEVTMTDMYLGTLKNVAEIAEMKDQDGNVISNDVDSSTEKTTITRGGETITDYNPKEDDIDYDWIKLKDGIPFAGKVWLDVPEENTKDTENSLLDSHEGFDKIKENGGVTAEIYQVKNGQMTLIATTSVKDDGTYEFKDVKKSDDGINYNNYIIQFKYHGINYTNVEYKVGTDYKINSKAQEELSERTAFNNKFAIINNQSEITYTTTSDDGAKKLASKYNYTDNMKMTAKTETISLNINTNTDELLYFNLGLKQRPTFDMALYKDVDHATVTVNGEEEIYTYDKYSSYNPESGTFDEFAYTIRNSDYNLGIRSIDRTEDAGLSIYVTYKINLINQSSTYGYVSKLVDYYDSHYTYASAQVKNNAGEIVDVGLTVTPYEESTISSSDANYYKMDINIGKNTNTILNNNENLYIYITLQFKDPASSLQTLSDGNSLRTMNFAEIAQYQTFDSKDGNTTPGLIDIDSAPGNFNIGSYKKGDYSEDDTDQAPALMYVDGDTPHPGGGRRTLTGNVFEDIDNADNINIKDVKVELIEIDASGNPIMENGSYRSVTYKVTHTDESGNYTFENYLPGKYIIRFSYGDSKQTVLITPDGSNATSYNGQDYASTDYVKENYADFYWYTSVKDKSDATDNVDRRNAVNEYSQTYNNAKAEILNSWKVNPIDENKVNTLIEKTNMFADTAKMRLSVEYGTPEVNSSDISEYKVEGIDFGLKKRPTTDIEIKKEVSKVTVTSSSGETLVSSDMEQGPKGKSNNVLWVEDSLVKIELEDALINGANLQIEYKVTLKNESEEGAAPTKVTGIIDYVDNDLRFEEENNTGWEVVTAEELQKDNEEESLVNNDIDLSKRQVILKASTNNPLIDKELQPGETLEEFATLTLTKTITTSNSAEDDLSYENIIEIVETWNAEGRKTGGTPGDLPPDPPPHHDPETGEDEAPTVTISNPTGQTQIYYVLGITIGVILIIGIVCIKKFVLRKKA